MIRYRRLVLATGTAMALVACAAASQGGPPSVSAVQPDTEIGTVQVTGAEPFPRLILRPANGDLPLRLIGPPVLQRVDGLQIQVAGKRAGDQFTVRSFLVVGANGQDATDGKLVQDGGTYYIVTQDGSRHPLVDPPANLRAHVGGRVWVSGPLDHEPIAYGIIQ
jgi:hypothetical protein